MEQKEPSGRHVLEAYLKPEHQYVLVGDTHNKSEITGWFYSDANLQALQKAGIRKIAVELPDDKAKSILDGSLSKTAYIEGKQFPESAGLRYDGIRKAAQMGFEISGIDVEQALENFIASRYVDVGIAGLSAETIAKAAQETTNLLLKNPGYMNFKAQTAYKKNYADLSEIEKSDLASAIFKKEHEDYTVDAHISDYIHDLDRRLAFDPKVAERIANFAGHDRVAVELGELHMTGDHDNVLKKLGLEKSLLIIGDGGHSFENGKVSDIAPYLACNPYTGCDLAAPNNGRYDPADISRLASSDHGKPYKAMDYTGVEQEKNLIKMRTVEAIAESALWPARKPDMRGPN